MVRKPDRIGSRRPQQLFLTEWMEHRGLDDERLAGRLDVKRETVNRWRNHPKRLKLPKLEQIAWALNCELPDLWRHPDRPSADALLRNEPEDIRNKAIEMIGILIKTG